MCEPDMRGPALTGGGSVGAGGGAVMRSGGAGKCPPAVRLSLITRPEVTDFYFGGSLEEMSAATAEALSRSPLTFPRLHTEQVVCVHECGTVRSLAPRKQRPGRDFGSDGFSHLPEPHRAELGAVAAPSRKEFIAKL